jgi:hypothetical protein
MTTRRAILRSVLGLSERSTAPTSTDSVLIHADGASAAERVRPALLQKAVCGGSIAVANDYLTSSGSLTGTYATVASKTITIPTSVAPATVMVDFWCRFQVSVPSAPDYGTVYTQIQNNSSAISTTLLFREIGLSVGGSPLTGALELTGMCSGEVAIASGGNYTLGVQMKQEYLTYCYVYTRSLRVTTIGHCTPT